MFVEFSSPNQDYSVIKKRRQELVCMVSEAVGGDLAKSGAILLLANFQNEETGTRFLQEPFFYYLSGLNEPGLALLITLQGDVTLYVPQFASDRSQWLSENISRDPAQAAHYGVTAIKPLGQPASGYQVSPAASRETFEYLIDDVQKVVQKDGAIYTLLPGKSIYPYAFGGQACVLEQFKREIAGFSDVVQDITPYIAQQRVCKDMQEVEIIHRAAEITLMAQEAAAQTICSGAYEAEVEARIAYIFTASNAQAAFPTIVAGGKKSTVLHCSDNNQELHDGELVVVDCGVQYRHYCADVTRTYPVSGTFSPRQREIYSVVLEAQAYIAECARPGYWLNNASVPDKSLNHLAKKFFQERGYGDYLQHGIGHYLGLQVHDVGDYDEPLREGMVITIEPGLYLPDEQIGIRIEDDYWIVKDGAVCLTEQLPKDPDALEQFMQNATDTPDTI